jgi:hypothetical protein
MAEIESKDNTNNKDKLGNAFVILFLNATDKDTPLRDILYSFNSKTFFTLIKGFLTKLAVLYNKTLVNSFNN